MHHPIGELNSFYSSLSQERGKESADPITLGAGIETGPLLWNNWGLQCYVSVSYSLSHWPARGDLALAYWSAFRRISKGYPAVNTMRSGKISIHGYYKGRTQTCTRAVKQREYWCLLHISSALSNPGWHAGIICESSPCRGSLMHCPFRKFELAVQRSVSKNWKNKGSITMSWAGFQHGHLLFKVKLYMGLYGFFFAFIDLLWWVRILSRKGGDCCQLGFVWVSV